LLIALFQFFKDLPVLGFCQVLNTKNQALAAVKRKPISAIPGDTGDDAQSLSFSTN
jgi:hypothetical protein